MFDTNLFAHLKVNPLLQRLQPDVPNFDYESSHQYLLRTTVHYMVAIEKMFNFLYSLASSCSLLPSPPLVCI